MSEDRAILAGGCYWGVQELLRRHPGDLDPSRVVRRGQPGLTDDDHGDHAEAVEIIELPQRPF